MGPAAYALCQKSIIGPAMWITGLCAFPPLIENVTLPLEAASTVTTGSFTVRIDKKYQLLLEFVFPSTDARLRDTVVGSRYAPECQDSTASLQGRTEFGQPIPIRVVIRSSKSKEVLSDTEFKTLCLQGHVDNRKWRSIGWINLTEGEYTAEVTNLLPQSGLAGVKTSFSLVAGGGK